MPVTDWLEEILRLVRREEPGEEDGWLSLRVSPALPIRRAHGTEWAMGGADAGYVAQQRKSRPQTEADFIIPDEAGATGWNRAGEIPDGWAAENPPRESMENLLTELSARMTAMTPVAAMTTMTTMTPEEGRTYRERGANQLLRQRNVLLELVFGEEREAGVRQGDGAQTRLRRLYRSVEKAVRGDGVTAVLREPEGGQEGTAAPGLSVQELDRAVRRDSRRYDGGMSIY